MTETTKTPTILLLEQDPELESFWKEALGQEGLRVRGIRTVGEAEVAAESDDPPDLVFLGTGFEGESGFRLLAKVYQRNSDVKVISPKDQAQVREELRAMKEKASGSGSPALKVNEVKVAIRNALEGRASIAVEPRAREEHRRFSEEISRKIIGESEEIQKLRDQVISAAETDDTTILLRGETGSGKGLVACCIHDLSGRKSARFVEVNCTAIPETLLESELFGHEAGAFTDAKTAKAGLFEAAVGGSIFLDEIGDMGPAVQAKLLQVLESKEVRRIGATSAKRVDVRVITATNQPLEALLKERKFREDLYFRLKVFPIQLPPLRTYLSDVVTLSRYFIQGFNREFHKEIQGLTFTAEKKLREYDYPGNVRELRNIIERAVILESGKFLSAENIALFGVPEKEGKEEGIELPEDLALEVMEKRMIGEALVRSSGNQSEAAKLLKITRFALRNRMKKFGLL